jgi:uncharacterized protein with GYD domain
MPKYLFEANYTLEGTRGLLKDGGSARKAAVEQMAAGLGGKMETFYYAFGGTDAYIIAELPDDVAAAAISMAVGAGGGATTRTTTLISAEQIDQAAKKSVAYRAPGA